MSTVAEALDKLERKRAAAMRELDERGAVLRQIPGDLPEPLVYDGRENIDTTARGLGWKNLDSPPPLVGILAALKEAGWRTRVASLVQWESWRPATYCAAEGDVPRKRGRDCLAETWPILPVWIENNYHTGNELHTYLQSPDGKPRRIALNTGSRPGLHVTAEKCSFKGGWQYVHGTGRMEIPEHWNTIIDATGRPIAERDERSAVYLNEQSWDAVIYWRPLIPMDEWRMEAHELAAYLLTGRRVAR